MTNEHHDEVSESETVPQGKWVTRAAFWFIVALVFRLLYLSEQGETSPLFFQPLLDELEAANSAKAILAGTTEAEPYFKAPGYSWLLAAVMAVSGELWYYAIRVIQHIGGAALTVVAIKSASLFCTEQRVRNIALPVTGFIFAFYAPLIRLESNIGLDFWSVFLQSLFLYYIIKVTIRSQTGKDLTAAGIFLALSWIMRPTITVALPFLCLWILLINRENGRFSLSGIVRGSAALLLPIVIIVLAVTVRNGIVSGQYIAMPWQGGYSFYYANAPGANGKFYLQNAVTNDSYANPTKGLSLQAYQQTTGRPDDLIIYKDVDRFWFQKGLAEIRADLPAWIKLMGRKTVYLFSHKEIFNYEEYELQKSLSPLLRFIPVGFGIIFPLGLALFAFTPRLTRRQKYGLFVIITYTAVLGGGIALYYTSGRMRMPLMFPIGIMAGAACGFLFHKGLQRREYIAAGLLVVGGIIISWGDWWGVRSEDMSHADYSRMSNAAWRSSDFESALNYALEAEKKRPDYPVLPILKGQAYYGLGDFPKAAENFLLALKSFPNDAGAMNNLGVIEHYENKNFAAAADWYAKALIADPARLTTRLRLVVCLVKVGKPEEARQILDLERVNPNTLSFQSRILFESAKLHLLHGNDKELMKNKVLESYPDNFKKPLLEEIGD